MQGGIEIENKKIKLRPPYYASLNKQNVGNGKWPKPKPNYK